MSKKKPNNFIAPIVIAGITVGFLASAYKFVFAKPKSKDIVFENQFAMWVYVANQIAKQPKV